MKLKIQETINDKFFKLSIVATEANIIDFWNIYQKIETHTEYLTNFYTYFSDLSESINDKDRMFNTLSYVVEVTSNSFTIDVIEGCLIDLEITKETLKMYLNLK